MSFDHIKDAMNGESPSESKLPEKWSYEETSCYPNAWKIFPVGNYRKDNAACYFYPTEELALSECMRREEHAKKYNKEHRI